MSQRSTPILKTGSKDPAVAELQRALQALAFRVEVTGEFDRLTLEAVRRFQASSGLPADGLVGPATWVRLHEAAAGRRDAPQSQTRAEPQRKGARRPRKPPVQTAPPDDGDLIQSGTKVFAPEVSPEVPEETVPPGDAAPAAETAESSVPDGILENDAAADAVLAADFVTSGFSSDAIAQLDSLGVTHEIEVLSAVLADRELADPVAVGIFGQWGSGKSSFMRQMQVRIATLADASARALSEGKESYFCPYVRQIYFNAWLHSDSDLWRSLAAAVHMGVAGFDSGAVNGREQALKMAEFQLRVAEQERLTERVEALDHEIDSLEKGVQEQVASLGPAGQTLLAAGESISEFKKLWHSIAAGFAGLRAGQRAAAVAVALFFSVAAGLLLANRQLQEALGAALLPVSVLVVGILAGLRRINELLDSKKKLARRSNEKGKIESELEAGALPEKETFAADPALLLRESAASRARWWMEQREVGVVGSIREDFVQYSDLMSKSRLRDSSAESQKSPAESTEDPGLVPLDRIVVYVDDLDRCRPDFVVSALEAIKLLMDLPNFVVVVGVDSRWLFRSLEIRFSDVLAHEHEVPYRAQSEWAPTPQNYLEKIFQVSLTLPPISREGFQRLVRNLLPVRFPPETTEPDEAPRAVDGDGMRVGADGHEVELTPRALEIEPFELDAMKLAAPVVQTPRAAKRLTNVYRMIRASLDTWALDGMLGRGGTQPEYPVLIILLGLAVGDPERADDVFRAILQADEKVPWAKFVLDLPGALGKSSITTNSEEQWARLAQKLMPADDDLLRDLFVGHFQAWLPLVVRYSFHPWRDITAA